MVKKNTKTRKKTQKVDKTTDLQESKNPMFTENPVESTENPVAEIMGSTENMEKTEYPVELPENPVESTGNQKEEVSTTMAMVYCKNCKKEVDPYSTEKGWKCPICNKFVGSPEIKKGGETIREVKASKDRPYEITSSRNIKFSGNELAQAEMLIQSGVANNFNDLAKKAFNILFLKEKVNKAFSGGDGIMELNKNKSDDTSEIIDKSLKQQLLQAQIDNMTKGGQQGQASDPLSTMMLMKMMDNQDKGKPSDGNGFMNQMFMMQMMQSMSKPQNDSRLQTEIAELKHQMQMNQIVSQQSQVQQGNSSSQDFMKQMEMIRAERDKGIKQAEIAAQQERDKNLELAFDNRRIELESRLQGMEKELKEKGSGQMATQRIKQMKEEIAAIKDMSKVLGEKEKSAGEYIGDTISNVASQLQPSVTKYIESRENQRAMQQQVMQQQPQQLPPEPTQIDQQPGMPLPPSDMTESERQMSEQMADMYLRSPAKKQE